MTGVPMGPPACAAPPSVHMVAVKDRCYGNVLPGLPLPAGT